VEVDCSIAARAEAGEYVITLIGESVDIISIGREAEGGTQ
jgi:hypothetical protein